MSKLPSLKPRIAQINTSRTAPIMVERITGRRLIERNRSLLEERPVCEKCRCNPSAEVDHIKPLHLGGHDDVWNLQVLCIDCHAVKTAAEKAERDGKSC